MHAYVFLTALSTLIHLHFTINYTRKKVAPAVKAWKEPDLVLPLELPHSPNTATAINAKMAEAARNQLHLTFKKYAHHH